MNANKRADRWAAFWIMLALSIALAVGMCSACASLTHFADSAKVGAGSAAGSGVGFIFGPLYGIIGAAVGGFLSYLFVALGAAETREALLAKAQQLSTWDLIVSRAVDFAMLAAGLLLVGWVLWAAAKMFLTPRGREGMASEVDATPLSPFAWIRSLLAADGLRHTRKK